MPKSIFRISNPLSVQNIMRRMIQPSFLSRISAYFTYHNSETTILTCCFNNKFYLNDVLDICFLHLN